MSLTIRRRTVPAHGPWPDDVPVVLQRVYAARGVCTPADAELRLQALHPPKGIAGIDAGVALLREALRGQWRVLVVGDFDCDGATATAVAVRGLRMLGFNHVDFRVPHRMRHGYGLSPGLVDELDSPLPDLILTVDNGVAAHAGVEAAHARGIRVLVTDHHLPGPTLPAADAIVDPCLLDGGFPSRHLAGVGVVFYLLLALRAALRGDGGGDGGGPDLSALLDLVALGTVADLVALDRNNRILVEAGLRRLRSLRGNRGLLALAEVAGRRADQLVAADLGFALGPRINAAGRLDDMRIGIDCLLTDDPFEAQALARRLDSINRERRDLQAQMVDEAQALASLAHAGEAPAAVSVFDAGWHPGVVGLVASRLKESLHRPVVALAPAGEESPGMLRGSARSIAGYHIRDALAAIDAAHPGLIARFGGHAMAAGLTLDAAHLDAFGDALRRHAESTLDAESLRAECWTDGELPLGECTRPLADALRQAGPWGQGFPEPRFDGGFRVLDWRVVGERHLKLRLSAAGASIDAIQFGGWRGEPPPREVAAVYRLSPDDYRDRGGVQLQIEHLLPA